jgi:hypothetical protein
MKKISVKKSPEREANKFAGIKAPKKAPGKPSAARKKTEWWRRPVEEVAENTDQDKPS